HIETHALLLYLLDRLKAVSTTDPWRSCIAVTDAGSYLAEHAHTYGFRAALLDPPGIKGRYSSLIHFSLLLSGLWRFDPADLASRAVAARELCEPHTPPDANPALALAALLAAGSASCHHNLLLLGTSSLQAATHRIAQLVGVSTS